LENSNNLGNRIFAESTSLNPETDSEIPINNSRLG
jgi:hypothetical protein